MKKIVLIGVLINLLAVGAFAQSSEFTYQGRLLDNSAPATANYDFQFSLWDSLANGTQVGGLFTACNSVIVNGPSAVCDDVAVTNGIFTVKLDFGAPYFNGSQRFLQISVRVGTSTGAYTPLAPRQPITSSPYSIKSVSSTTADGLTPACVLCVTDAHILSIDGAKVTGTVANATTATNVSGVVAIANGGTGSATKNFVDISTNQNVLGNKTFFGQTTFGSTTFSGPATFNNGVTFNNADPVTVNGELNVGGVVTADQFYGNGDGLVNVPATSLSGVVPITNGGTGSLSQNFVDLSTNQLSIGGDKNFTGMLGGNGSGLKNVTAQTTTNLSLLGSLRWDLLRSKSFAVGTSPHGIAFDGGNIWVANRTSNNVTKLRASDGAVLGNFPTAGTPVALAFDGANMWVTNDSGTTVTKLRASDGSNLGNFTVGNLPWGVAFDGANVWVANQADNNVTKLRASDGANLGNFTVGNSPLGVAFDGANIWVTNTSSGNVTKLRASDGAVQGTFAVGTSPFGIAFDGASVWVANQTDNNVTKLRATDGAVLGTFAVGIAPIAIAFDGVNIWVVNRSGAIATKLRASDGAVQGTIGIGSNSIGIAFDGANMWVTSNSSNNVVKLPVFP